jgi:hypothetical protein
MEEQKTQIEEGCSQLIKNHEIVYSLTENSDKKNDRLYICINYQEKLGEDELATLYTDEECKNKFKELKPSKGLNSIYTIEISESKKLYLKSNLTCEYFFYYKYCTEKDIEQVKINKKNLKVKFVQKLKNSMKISFNCPFTCEEKFNTKYKIYISEGKNKKYKIFKDEEEKDKRTLEGLKDTYEIEVKIDPNKKDLFFYVVAESKDSNVSLRPKIIYKGEKVPETESMSENIINGILIVLIIITFFYKVYKRRMKAKQAQGNAGNSTLI